MRVGYDSVNPVGCPPDGDVYMGYTDGNYPSYEGMRQRFPGKAYVGITVRANGEGHLVDVEAGDPTPVEGAALVRLRRSLGQPYFGIYCSGSNVPVCVAELERIGVPAPWYFSYAHTGVGPEFDSWPGVIVLSKQYIQNAPYNGSSYDKSSVIAHWPGVDPEIDPPLPPVPVPPQEEEDPMLFVALVDATGDGVADSYWMLGGPGGYSHVVGGSDPVTGSPVANLANLQAQAKVDGGGVKFLPGAFSFGQHQAWLTASAGS